MEINSTTEIEKTEMKTEQAEPYEDVKVNTIKKLLEMLAQQGKPSHYKINMNNLEVVSKTNDLQKFDTYKNFLESSGILEITIYGPSNSPRIKSKRVFILSDDSAKLTKPQELNGLETETKIEERLMKHFEGERVKTLLAETLIKLHDAEEYIEELQGIVEKQAGEKIVLSKERNLEDKNLGAIFSGIAEGIIRNNTKFIASIPGAENLAGLIDKDSRDKANRTTEEPSSATETTFTEMPPELSADDKKAIEFFKGMKEELGEENSKGLMLIMEHLSENQNDIKTVVKLLEINQN
ncbi:MAG TPA: hypothetical protein VK808_06885 [Bacteroidia bacterium]|jgi:hypothetical protein|nr:hypothetical protein [Bacteroidia bacterium]